MRKLAVVIGLSLLFACAPSATVPAADRQGGVATDIQEVPDTVKGYACDCCQKCRAARRPVAPESEKGPAKANGCKECCDRCGKNLPPDPDGIPEVIEKEIPPEIKDRPRR